MSYSQEDLARRWVESLNEIFESIPEWMLDEDGSTIKPLTDKVFAEIDKANKVADSFGVGMEEWRS